MYFDQFGSYEKVIQDTKAFRIEVVTSTSEVVRSSDMPSEVMGMVADAIDACEETRTSFHVWDHTKRTVTIVPYASISSLRIVLL